MCIRGVGPKSSCAKALAQVHVVLYTAMQMTSLTLTQPQWQQYQGNWEYIQFMSLICRQRVTRPIVKM